MKKSVSPGQWIVAVAVAGSVLGLSILGAKLFLLALVAAPAVMGVVWWSSLAVPPVLNLTLLAGLCSILFGVASPATACFFAASIFSGLLLRVFVNRGPDEDDCYFWIPALYLLVLSALFVGDSALRQDSAWDELRSMHSREIAESRETLRLKVGAAQLRPEEKPRWQAADDMLPYQVTGVVAVTAAIAFYAILAPFRFAVASGTVRNRFVHFRVKSAYMLLLILAMAAQALWVTAPRPWVGHLAYALTFFCGGALVLEAVSLAAFFGMRRKDTRNRALAWIGALAACIAALTYAKGPAVIVGAFSVAILAAAPAALVGLADAWMDFRHLDNRLDNRLQGARK